MSEYERLMLRVQTMILTGVAMSGEQRDFAPSFMAGVCALQAEVGEVLGQYEPAHNSLEDAGAEAAELTSGEND